MSFLPFFMLVWVWWLHLAPWPAGSFAQRQNKKLPKWEVLCGSNKLLEDRQDFVACFALCSFFSPQFCSSLARLNSWYIRKPVVAFNRYLRPFGRSTAQWRMTDLLHDPRFQPKPENTNSRYSTDDFSTTLLVKGRAFDFGDVYCV